MAETEDYDKSATPTPHASTHEDGGTDEIIVGGLAGQLADAQPSTWPLVSGKPSTFTPEAHKTSHQDGGSDEISVAGLSGLDPLILTTGSAQEAEADKVKLWAQDLAPGSARLHVQGETGNPIVIGENGIVLNNLGYYGVGNFESAYLAWLGNNLVLAQEHGGSGVGRVIVFRDASACTVDVRGSYPSLVMGSIADFGTVTGFGANVGGGVKYFKMITGTAGAGFLYDNGGIFAIEAQASWPGVGGSGISGLTMDGIGRAYFGILGVASALGRLSIWAGDAAIKGLVIRGYTSQSANLLELQDVNANIKAEVDEKGQFGSNIAEDTDFDDGDVISTGITASYGMLVVRDSVDGVCGLFRVQNQTVSIMDADALYSTTKDTAAHYNVYWETDQFKVQNKVGDNKNTRIGFYGI